jgi:probable O-glycosylation ligase (exosortase A-associated)
MKGLIFTYLLTYGGALVSLYRPFYGLLIYICFAIIRPDFLWWYSVPSGNYSRIVAIALLLGWCLHGFGTWRFDRARGVVVALTGFVLWSALLSFDVVSSFAAWSFVEYHLKILLPFLVGITLINSARQVLQLAWVIVLSQGYLSLEFNLSYYSGFNYLVEIGFGNLDNNCIAITLDSCIGLAFFLILYSARLWQKALAAASGLLMSHAVLFSNSRGGMLGLIVTGCVAFLLIRKQPKHYLILLLAVVIALRLAGTEVVARFETIFADKQHRDQSASMRVRHWEASIDSIARRPWGVGPAQWRYYCPQYGLPMMEAHSYWLQTTSELGFPGLAWIAAFYGLCIVRLWPLARERIRVSDPWVAYLAKMTISSLAGFVVSSQFVSVSGVEAPFYVALIGAGILKIAWTGEGASAARTGPPQVALVAGPPHPSVIGAAH